MNLRSFGAPSLAEHVGALAELRDAGLIRHLGLSNVGPEQLAEAQTITPVVCVQNRYALDSRRSDSDDMWEVPPAVGGRGGPPGRRPPARRTGRLTFATCRASRLRSPPAAPAGWPPLPPLPLGELVRRS